MSKLNIASIFTSLALIVLVMFIGLITISALGIVDFSAKNDTSHSIQNTENPINANLESDIIEGDAVDDSEQELFSDLNTPTDKPVIYTAGPFKDIDGYSEGLIAVQDNDNGMWGYIDKKGNYIIEPQYFATYPFKQGLAAVQKSNGYYSFINKNNELVIDLDIKSIQYIMDENENISSSGYALVTFNGDKYSKVIDVSGNILSEHDSISERESSNGLNLYDGLKNAIPVKYDFPEESRLRIIPDVMRDYNQSTNYIAIEDNSSDLFLIVGQNGDVLFDKSTLENSADIENNHISFCDDFLCIQRNLNGIKTVALYDYFGNIVIDYQYTYVLPINDNAFIVYNQADKMAIIDRQGNELVPFSLNLKSMEKYFSEHDEIIAQGGAVLYSKGDDGTYSHKFYDMYTNEIIDTVSVNTGINELSIYSFIEDGGKSKTALFAGSLYSLDGEVLLTLPSTADVDRNQEYLENSMFVYKDGGYYYLTIVDTAMQ